MQDSFINIQLGNYRVISLLGRGGFADVYLAEHLHLHSQAAIKIPRTYLGSDQADEFLKEAQIMADLKHPLIVRLFDYGVNKGTPYLIMEYAPKGSLRDKHKMGTRVSLEEIMLYVKQIADALVYTHARNIIHRDIKPQNILLGSNDEILLSDFGIAIIINTSHEQIAQSVAGTIQYMAPELLQMEAQPCPASDQYALAVVVYEWLCGELPFQGTMSQITTQLMIAPPPSLCQKVPGLPLAVEEVVMKALAKDPQERFAHIQEFAQALEQAISLAKRSEPHFSSVQEIAHALEPDISRVQEITQALERAISQTFPAPDESTVPVHEQKRFSQKRPKISVVQMALLIAALIIFIMAGIVSRLFFTGTAVTINFGPKVLSISQIYTMTATSTAQTVDANTAMIPIESFASTPFSASKSGATSGQNCFLGLFPCQQVVDKRDVDRLVAQIEPGLEKTIEQQMQASLATDGRTALAAVNFTVVSTKANPTVGKPGNSVSVTLVEKGSLYYILNADADKVAEYALRSHVQQMGANYTLLRSTIIEGKPIIGNVAPASNSASVEIAAGADVSYQFPASQLLAIRTDIKNMSLSDANRFLANQPGIAPNTISMHFTQGNGPTLPDNIQNITIIPINADPTAYPPVQLQAAPTQGATSMTNAIPFLPSRLGCRLNIRQLLGVEFVVGG